MIYPVNRFKEDWNLTAGYRFGAVTSYGRHEGDDLNKNGGGDIELGELILQIAKGEMLYWHKSKHPETGFGYHSVSKIVGPWGTRWVHNAHMQFDTFITSGVVEEGQEIGKVGKSGISRTGTKYAHDHFAIFKVDPATLRDGIDTIATNEQELNDWWEEPIKFIETWMKPDFQAELDKVRAERDRNWNMYLELNEITKGLRKEIEDLKKQIGSFSLKNEVLINIQREINRLI